MRRAASPPTRRGWFRNGFARLSARVSQARRAREFQSRPAPHAAHHRGQSPARRLSRRQALRYPHHTRLPLVDPCEDGQAEKGPIALQQSCDDDRHRLERRLAGRAARQGSRLTAWPALRRRCSLSARRRREMRRWRSSGSALLLSGARRRCPRVESWRHHEPAS